MIAICAGRYPSIIGHHTISNCPLGTVQCLWRNNATLCQPTGQTYSPAAPALFKGAALPKAPG